MVIPHGDKKIQKSKTCVPLKDQVYTHKLAVHEEVKYNCDHNESKGASKS